MTTHLNNVSILLNRAMRVDCKLSPDERALFNQLQVIDSKVSEIYSTPLEGEDDPTIVEHWTRFGPEVAYHNSHRAVVVARAIERGATSLNVLKDVCISELGVEEMRGYWDDEEGDLVDADPTIFLESCLALHEALGDRWILKAYMLWGTLAANWDHEEEQYLDEWALKCERYDRHVAYEASIVLKYLKAQAA